MNEWTQIFVQLNEVHWDYFLLTFVKNNNKVYLQHAKMQTAMQVLEKNHEQPKHQGFIVLGRIY